MNVSISSREQNRVNVSWSCLLASHSTTTRRAACTIADFTTASMGSGVESPKRAWAPLHPTNARSGRSWS